MVEKGLTEATPTVPGSLTFEEAEAILQRMAGIEQSAAGERFVPALSRAGSEHEIMRTTSGAASLLPASRRSVPEWDQATLHAVLESVPDAVIAADADGAIVLVNRQTENLFGYTRAELLGRPVELLMPERFRAGHIGQRAQYFSDPKIRPMGANLELWGQRSDGSEFPVEISLSPMACTAGMLVTATIRDVSQRREAENQLRHAEARYRTLVEEIPIVTFMAALDKSAAQISELYVSPQIETLLGFTQREWLEDPVLWYARLHPDDRERWHAEFARTCSTAEPFESIYRFIARDGRVVWVHGHAKVVRDRDGQPLFLQGGAFDITQRKQAEEAMAQLNQVLAGRVAEAVAEAEERAKELARSNEALKAFSDIASHDLREPLRTILRYMQLLEREQAAALDEIGREYVSKAIAGARRMNQLIDDLHTHSRIGKKGKVDAVACDGALAEAYGNLRAAIAESRAVVTADPLPTIPAVRSELVLLFQNLMQNSLKFRAERAPTIHIGARREGDHWLLWVEDNGAGIEPQYLERIFGIGERLHGREISGTGFGLANCKKIVEHHGGAIWAESQLGVGSKFLFTLSES